MGLAKGRTEVDLSSKNTCERVGDATGAVLHVIKHGFHCTWQIFALHSGSGHGRLGSYRKELWNGVNGIGER
jgi:hypothetical protein